MTNLSLISGKHTLADLFVLLSVPLSHGNSTENQPDRPSFRLLVMILIFLVSNTQGSQAQTTIFSAGSLIIDMGIVPQTVANALKPYGLVYQLIKDNAIPVNWVINTTKVKDGVDFNYNGYDFRGGPFIINAEYRTPEVNNVISLWIAQGVVTVTTTSPITVPASHSQILSAAPRWTLDKENGAIALDFFTNAGIPNPAFGGPTTAAWKLPSQLGLCDDIFVMPHADPTWATHKNLITWNKDYRGSIWLGCHAGSALHNMYNPANPSEQANFLTEKVTTPGTGIILPVLGSTAYAQNSLVLWSHHADGLPPYAYDYGEDPIMQFMGTLDAATQNGSEQIFVPTSAGWRTTTNVTLGATAIGGYDPANTQNYLFSNEYKYRSAVIAHGYGYGDKSNGLVMVQAGHDIGKETLPANIAAQRAFFNFSFIAAKIASPDPGFSFNLAKLVAGDPAAITFEITPPRLLSEFDIQWTSGCGGTFGSSTEQSTTFTPPQVTTPTTCLLTVTLTERSICRKVYRASIASLVVCNLRVTTTTTPACYGQTNGSVSMNIQGGPAPFVWNWTKSGGTDTGSGTGKTISNLAAGTYTVTVTGQNGTGCSKTFTVTVNQNPLITIVATPTNVSCPGGSNGSITVAVSAGMPKYTYLWADGATTQNRKGLPPGTYNLIVTDSKGCTASGSATISQPSAITITPSYTHILCDGKSTGAISLVVTGGTGTYSYLWNDGNALQNRTGISAGTYSVRVTDTNGCSLLVSGLTITQPAALTASVSASQIQCNGGTSEITALASGGTGSAQYSLDGSVFTATNTFSNLSASATPYQISVKDENNCITTTNVTIVQPALLVINTVVAQPTCPPAADSPVNSDGAIDLSVSGGTGPYTYNWTTVGGSGLTPSNQDQISLTAGTYSVTVTDSRSCISSKTLTLQQLNSLPVTPGTIKR